MLVLRPTIRLLKSVYVMGALIMTSIEYTEKHIQLSQESNLGPLGPESFTLNIRQRCYSLAHTPSTICLKNKGKSQLNNELIQMFINCSYS